MSNLKKYQIDGIHQAIYRSFNNNDLDTMKSILNSENYPSLTQLQKETEVFNALCHCFTYGNESDVGNDLLKYIIFEYKITEDVCLVLDNKHKLINDMFQARKLNEELNQELAGNDTVLKKKVKL